MKFDFTNSSGEVLSGSIELPADPPRAFALFLHCFTCTKDSVAPTVIARELSENGIGILRFDFTGIGASEGDFSNTNFSSNIDDVLAAYTELAKRFRAPEILIGHSLGGAAALKAATLLKEVKAVVTIGAPSDVKHLSHLFSDNLSLIKEKRAAEISIAGTRFTLKKQFIEDLEKTEFLEAIGHFRKALLVMHAPLDNVVSIDHATEIFTAAKHPKSFITLDNADHLLSKKSDAEYAANVIGAWVNRYLSKTKSPKSSKVSPQPGTVVVNSRDGAKFTNDVYTIDHHTVADEPLSVNGDNLGFTPYDLLLASLGACTSMTMRMYADLKGIPLQGAKVVLRHEKIHSEDCKTCESKKGKIDRIIKTISLAGNLTAEEKQKLFAIAEKCPVNRTLKSEILIETHKE